MDDRPESLPATVDGDELRLTIVPTGHRSADEAVGFVLLPVLMVLVAVSVAYLLAVLGLALSGHDPALTIGRWRPGFVGLGVATWVVATVWYRRRMGREVEAAVELALDGEAVTLREADGAVRWRVRLSEVARAEVRSRPSRRLRLVMAEDETREVVLSGVDEDGAGWLVAVINQKVGARSAGE